MLKLFLKSFAVLVSVSLIAVLIQYFSYRADEPTQNKNIHTTNNSQSGINYSQNTIKSDITVNTQYDEEDKYAPAKMMIEMITNFAMLMASGILFLAIWKHIHRFRPHTPIHPSN